MRHGFLHDQKRKTAFAAASRRAFTLIEIMMVVAILGLVAAMGLPSLVKSLEKEGMRKAVSDLVDVCSAARAKAIMLNTTVGVIFHPAEKSFEVEGGGPGHGATYVTTSKLPDSVDFAMLDIDQTDCVQRDSAVAQFYPNGTSNELTIVLHAHAEWKKITVEFATGSATVSDVDK